MIAFPEHDAGLGGLLAATMEGVPITLDMGQAMSPNEDSLPNLGVNARIKRLERLLKDMPANGGTLVPKGAVNFFPDAGYAPDGWLQCNSANAGVHNGVIVPNWEGMHVVMYGDQSTQSGMDADDHDYNYNSAGAIVGLNVHGYYGGKHVNNHLWTGAGHTHSISANNPTFNILPDGGAPDVVDNTAHDHGAATGSTETPQPINETDNRPPSVVVYPFMYVGTS